MKFSKINAWLHLWLGLISGAIVFIVAITGCILVFEEELKDLFYAYRHAPVTTNSTTLPPSVLIPAAEQAMPGLKATSIQYHAPGKTAEIHFPSDSFVYIDPYTARVTAVVDHEDFFHEVTEGHTGLWLPPEIGTRVVSYATLVFAILLVTGMVLWWPKKWNKHNIRNAFTILWTGKFKRVNYDLHNVLGFYTLPVALVIAYSGIFMGFSWFSSFVFKATTGGQTMPVYYTPPSDSTFISVDPLLKIIDHVWVTSVNELAEGKSPAVYIGFPDKKDETIYVYTSMEKPYYQAHYFDRNSGKLLQGGGVDVKPFDEANLGEQLMRLNYSLHVGAIWGIWSKIIFFTGSLVAATLPVTGFYIWWGKKKKKTKKSKKVLQNTL